MSLVAEAKRMLETALGKPGLGAETEVGRAIVKALSALGNAIPEGAVSPGMQRAGMQEWMVNRRQQNPMMNIMAALGQGGGAGAGAAPPPPGAGAGMPAM